MPAILPVGEIVHRGDGAIAQLDQLRVYPNGFTIELFILTDPHRDVWAMGGAAHAGEFPRIGVRFADGGTAGREGWFGAPHDVPKDADGIPSVPILRPLSGGGGSSGYRVSAWVFPLPPDGPVEVFVSLPGVEAESRVELDGATIRSAAAGAIVVWT